MRTSATGTRRVRNARGFTLIELLAVVFAIGLFVSLIALSLGGIGGPRPDAELRELADRIALAHDGATLSGQTLGMRRTPDGVEFVALAIDPATRRAAWEPLPVDRALAPQRFAAPFRFALEVEGDAVAARSATPQVLLLPDGDMTPFRITLGAEGARSARLVGAEDGTMRIDEDGDR